MEVLHITPTRNVKSIMKSEILRCKPILPKFNEVMEEYYGDDYNKDKGLVFGFPETIPHRDRIIRDFIYWKTWGDNRNKFLAPLSHYEYEELENFGPQVFSHIQIKANHFSILLLDIEHEPLFDYYQHKQSSDMGEFWTDMDVRYEHNDKPLTLMNYDVDTSKIIKIIGTAEAVITKTHKIDVSLDI